uniref:Uncharacterized protein n=1 Tax=Siphoviridae sp. ctAvy12 TaxID=2825371 RepID=A0A8S5URZ9_9CAUD|nr:MAG TPA: hypothetical protein [Siphoviridae sp. ctAvy12]DAW67149.1 MAG TPA: hypothetical protein [Caudoviricetes sp.]
MKREGASEDGVAKRYPIGQHSRCTFLISVPTSGYA